MNAIKKRAKREFLVELIALHALTSHQLNSTKNKKKTKLEDMHSLQLVDLCIKKLGELKREFNTEQEIKFEKVLEKIGDVGAYLVGIIAWSMRENEE